VRTQTTGKKIKIIHKLKINKMNITNKTVLITGGGSGIGLEIAKQLIAKGNKVIITGRSANRLEKAIAGLNNISAFAADITKAEDVEKLIAYLNDKHIGLDVLINNAGQAYVYPIEVGVNSFGKASEEILTNYLSVVRLTESLLPALNKQAEAAIVNVTSIVAFAPGAMLSTYAASKAALHSYTQSLRFSLAKTTGIKVFELMPPLVDTELSVEIGGKNGIPPSQVADELLAGLASDTYEIHVSGTADFYKLYLSSPDKALEAINQPREL
jgi:uncharacterized oxidoreductase